MRREHCGDQHDRIDEPVEVVGHEQHGCVAREVVEADDLHPSEGGTGRDARDERDESVDRTAHVKLAGLADPRVGDVIAGYFRPGHDEVKLVWLREALESVAQQTWPNIEAIVVEDGPQTSQGVIDEFRRRLVVRYRATGDKVGRARAGNLALAEARGEWLNFLDDDDLAPGPRDDGQRRGGGVVGRDEGERPVVPGGGEDRPQGGVDEPVGLVGGLEGDPHGRGEDR